MNVERLHTMIDIIIEELKEINTRLSILESKRGGK
jgi:hypothetical protein